MVHVEVDFVGEDAECALDETDDAVGMAARTATFDGRQAALERAAGSCSVVAAGDLDQIVRDRRKAVHARAALARALGRELADDPRGLEHAARACGERDDRPRSERAAERGEAGVGERAASAAAAGSHVPK